MARGRYAWAHSAVVWLVNAGVLGTAQALRDRVPSSASNKAAEADRRTLITAGAAALLGVGGVLGQALGGWDWAGRVGEGLLAGATGAGTELGIAALDAKMGLKDPPVTPQGFLPQDVGYVPPPKAVAGNGAAAAGLPPAVADGFNPLRAGYSV